MVKKRNQPAAGGVWAMLAGAAVLAVGVLTGAQPAQSLGAAAAAAAAAYAAGTVRLLKGRLNLDVSWGEDDEPPADHSKR